MERDELTMMMAANIQSIMESKGINAAQLARDAKLNPTGIYDIISGKSKNPRLDTLHKIARALYVPVSSLLEEKSRSEIKDQIVAALEVLPDEEREKLLLTAKVWSGES